MASNHSSPSSTLDPSLEKYAFKIPVLFEGDRGSGKTVGVRAFAKHHELTYLEIAGHESLESYEFLGKNLPHENTVVWSDGKLSRAFRLAASGQKVVLCIDEMLRIPQRQLSILLTALSPDLDGNLRLSTGRILKVEDGVGQEEEILAPADRICICATTNVGPEFAVEDLDPAVAERFIIVRKDTHEAQLKNILMGQVKDKQHFSHSDLVTQQLVEFFKKTQRCVQTGQLNRAATTRTLVRSIQLANNPQELREVLLDHRLLWVDRSSTGHPVKEQMDLLQTMIGDLFADDKLVKKASSKTSVHFPQGAKALPAAKTTKKIEPKTPSTPAKSTKTLTPDEIKEIKRLKKEMEVDVVKKKEEEADWYKWKWDAWMDKEKLQDLWEPDEYGDEVLLRVDQLMEALDEMSQQKEKEKKVLRKNRFESL